MVGGRKTPLSRALGASPLLPQRHCGARRFRKAVKRSPIYEMELSGVKNFRPAAVALTPPRVGKCDIEMAAYGSGCHLRLRHKRRPLGPLRGRRPNTPLHSS